MSMETQAKIRSIVVDLFDLETDDLRDDQDLKDVGIDSLMALDILTALEKNFRIKLREESMRRFTSIEGISSLVEEELARAA
jgi:acyl carrier protein